MSYELKLDDLINRYNVNIFNLVSHYYKDCINRLDSNIKDFLIYNTLKQRYNIRDAHKSASIQRHVII